VAASDRRNDEPEARDTSTIPEIPLAAMGSLEARLVQPWKQLAA